VMGELKATREAIDVHTGQHDEVAGQLDDHEKRLKVVEKQSHIPVLS